MDWQRGTRTQLSWWEFQAILDASKSYCDQWHGSQVSTHPPPYGNPWNDFDRDEVSAKIKSSFKAFMNRKR